MSAVTSMRERQDPLTKGTGFECTCRGSLPIARLLKSSPSKRILYFFQYTIFSQQKDSGTKYSVSRDLPVQNNQSVGIFQDEIISQ
jgi:hypothetical protein